MILTPPYEGGKGDVSLEMVNFLLVHHGIKANRTSPWRVYHNVKLLSLCRVILNVVKNLNTSTIAFQILRDAQDDKMIGDIHYAIPFYIQKEIYIILTI